jgi:hypothetical protein
MGPTLLDDVWTRRGISILWDAEQLAALCQPKEVVSLRRFLQLHSNGWPEAELSLVNNDRVLVVAGLETCIDALPPDDACNWLERTIYQALVSFQREVAHGAEEAALILWFVDHRRLVYQTSDDTYYWHCGTEYKGQQIPLSRCLFNGAQHDLRQIHAHPVGDKKTEHWVGLYHPRIS